MSQGPQEPESHILPPTPHVPNSPLPFLVYRHALPTPVSETSASSFFESNNWIKGGAFKHYPSHHFHSITHECYAVISGNSTMLYGKGPLDDEATGVEVHVEEGDVVVHAAGVAHCNLSSSSDFSYIGVYPKGSPHWDNNFCKASPEETAEKAENARKVAVPDYDPVHGLNGPLVSIWRAHATAAAGGAMGSQEAD